MVRGVSITSMTSCARVVGWPEPRARKESTWAHAEAAARRGSIEASTRHSGRDRARNRGDAAARTHRCATEAREATDNPRPRVLVVDDHALFRQVVRELLEEEGGYDVEEAADGHAALARIRAAGLDERPLVVLLDYFLPGLTGGPGLRHPRAEGGAGGAPTPPLH